jgi:alpha-2-macroglobulin
VLLDAGALAATLPRRTARALQWGFALPTLVDAVRPEVGATDLGAWPLLEVDLNYAVECTPTLRTFSIKPKAVGLLGCRASNIVFTPTVSLDPGVEYVAALAHVFLKGDATPRPGVQWEFSTAPPLTIIDWEPVSTGFLVDLTSAVRIQFNRPVDPASVLSRFSLQTAEGQQVAGQSTWESGGSTFVFQPAGSLRPGIGYKFSLRQGVRDELGFELEEPLSATFDTLQMLGRPTPLPGTRQVPLDSVVRVPFTRPMDKDSVETGLTVRPPLEGQITWEENTLVLAPTGGLAAETLYEFVLGADVRDATGAPLSRPSRWAFETEPFLLDAEVPVGAEITQLGRPISLTFALPMDRASVEAALTISPTTPGSLRWSEDGRSLSFQPEPGWEAGSDYYVALSSTARAADGGQTLGQDLVQFFSTAVAEVQFGEGPNIQVMSATGDRGLQVVFRGADMADLALYPVAPTEILDYYSSNSDGTGRPTHALLLTSALTATVTWRAPLVPVEDAVAVPGWTPAEVVLPPGVAEGIYLLSALPLVEDNGVLLVVLTQHALVAKTSMAGGAEPDQLPGAVGTSTGTRQVLVWDTSFSDRAPVVSSTVRLYDAEARLLAEGQTDARGLCQVALPDEAGPVLVLSEKDGDVSVCGLGYEWSESEWWGSLQEQAVRPTHRIYAYTDRPIYHPGQTIRFKEFVRVDEDAAYSLPPQDLPVAVRLRDALDNVAASQVLTPTAFGTVYGQFELADPTMLGTWHLESVAGGTISRQPFQVQEYREAEYAVVVDTSHTVYVQGEAISVTVEASYYCGQPVAGADVALKIYSVDALQADAGREQGFGIPVLVSAGTTDEEGRWESSLETGDVLDLTGREEKSLLALEATVSDEAGQSGSNYTLVTLRHASQGLSLILDGYGFLPGQEIVFAGEVQGRNGEPVPGVIVVAQVLGWDDQPVAEATATTNDRGHATFSMQLQEEGWYQVKLSGTDDGGRALQAREWIWVLDPDGEVGGHRAQASKEEPLLLRADREAYSVGEEAQIAVQALTGGPALLTIERGETRAAWIVELITGTNLITVPIRADYVPNVHVALNQFGPQYLDAWPRQSWPASALRVARATLLVPALDRELRVSLAPGEGVLAPGDEITVHIEVSDHKDRPVRAEIGLAVVDEATYAQAADLGGDPFEAFYGQRPNLVNTFDSLRPTRWLHPEGEGMASNGETTGAPRRNLPDTAWWLPAVVTGDDGRAQVQLTLPDELNEWRILARAVTTDTRLGQATASLVTTQDILLRPNLPRFLVQGDVLTVTAAVHNFASVPVSATVSLEVEGMAPAGPASPQVIHVPAGASAAAAWPVAVDAHASWARVGLRATATYRGATLVGRDAAEARVPVVPMAVHEVASFAGQLTRQQPQEVLTVTLPSNALQGLSRLEVNLAPSLAAGLVEDLEYLIDYPHGCVEQTMSRVLPNAIAAQAFRRVGIQEEVLEVDLPLMMDVGLQKLYGFQHVDGGWGWWYDDVSDVHQTAYVLLGLGMTQRAGYEVDDSVMGRGVEALMRMLPGSDLESQAYGAYVLATAGQPVTMTLSLTEAMTLDPFHQAALALALDAAGEASVAGVLLDELGDAAVQDEAGIHWRVGEEHGYQQPAMGSDVRATAMVVTALVRLDPENPLLPGAVRWLMGQRQAQGWGDTQSTSFAIVALTDYLLLVPERPFDASYAVYVNDLAWGQGQLSQPDEAQTWVLTYTGVLSPPLLLPGENRVELHLTDTQPTSSPLYYHLVLDALEPGGEAIPAREGHERSIAIERTYRLWGTQEPRAEYRQGDLVEVRLTLDVPEESWYVLLNDPLPAGLWALSESLGSTSRAVSGEEDPAFYWQENGYNRKEVHDRGVTLFFAHLQAGRHSFTYLARAAVPGAFSALPAEAYPMYEPEVWSRSSSARLRIMTGQSWGSGR